MTALRQRTSFPGGDGPARLALSYAIRAEGVTTDRGVFFEIVDVSEWKVVSRTEPVTGTRPWTRETHVFQVSDPRDLELRLRRLPSDRLDDNISGTVWIDEVGLRRVVPEDPAQPD